MLRGQDPIGGKPSKAKYLESLYKGFAVGVNQEFFAPASILGSSLMTAGVAAAGDIAGDLLSGQSVDWRMAIKDFVVTAAIGLLVNPVSVKLLRPNAAVADEVARFASAVTGPALFTEVTLLLHMWLP